MIDHLSGLTSKTWFWSLIFFVLGTLVNLCTQEIRQFFKTSSTKSASVGRKKLENKLQLLMWLHNNSYALTLWALREVLASVSQTLGILAVGGCIVFGLAILRYPSTSTIFVYFIWHMVISVLIGLFVGTALRMYDIVLRLYSYDRSVERLTGIIQQLSDTALQK